MPPAQHSDRGERGAGSILVLSAAMVTIAALLAATVLASGHQARRQAAAAADLAALAAAESIRAGESSPCRAAERVAAANDATMHECVITATEAHVQVGVHVAALRDWLPEQVRWARAGPAPLDAE